MTDEELTLDQEDVSEEQELSEEEEALAKLKEAITVEREDIGSLRVKLTVTIPRERDRADLANKFRATGEKE